MTTVIDIFSGGLNLQVDSSLISKAEATTLNNSDITSSVIVSNTSALRPTVLPNYGLNKWVSVYTQLVYPDINYATYDGVCYTTAKRVRGSSLIYFDGTRQQMAVGYSEILNEPETMRTNAGTNDGNLNGNYPLVLDIDGATLIYGGVGNGYYNPTNGYGSITIPTYSPRDDGSARNKLAGVIVCGDKTKTVPISAGSFDDDISCNLVGGVYKPDGELEASNLYPINTYAKYRQALQSNKDTSIISRKLDTQYRTGYRNPVVVMPDGGMGGTGGSGYYPAWSASGYKLLQPYEGIHGLVYYNTSSSIHFNPDMSTTLQNKVSSLVDVLNTLPCTKMFTNSMVEDAINYYLVGTVHGYGGYGLYIVTTHLYVINKATLSVHTVDINSGYGTANGVGMGGNMGDFPTVCIDHSSNKLYITIGGIKVRNDSNWSYYLGSEDLAIVEYDIQANTNRYVVSIVGGEEQNTIRNIPVLHAHNGVLTIRFEPHCINRFLGATITTLGSFTLDTSKYTNTAVYRDQFLSVFNKVDDSAYTLPTDYTADPYALVVPTPSKSRYNIWTVYNTNATNEYMHYYGTYCKYHIPIKFIGLDTYTKRWRAVDPIQPLPSWEWAAIADGCSVGNVPSSPTIQKYDMGLCHDVRESSSYSYVNLVNQPVGAFKLLKDVDVAIQARFRIDTCGHPYEDDLGYQEFYGDPNATRDFYSELLDDYTDYNDRYKGKYWNMTPLSTYRIDYSSPVFLLDCLTLNTVNTVDSYEAFNAYQTCYCSVSGLWDRLKDIAGYGWSIEHWTQDYSRRVCQASGEDDERGKAHCIDYPHPDPDNNMLGCCSDVQTIGNILSSSGRTIVSSYSAIHSKYREQYLQNYEPDKIGGY